jgi:enhancing lycopene biosynthesis protein 2
MKNVAVVLSGCGVFDGAEINEVVLSLLALEEQGVIYQCFAPNKEQHHVIDHTSGNELKESRNVMLEAARIVRGNILPLSDLQASNFDGLVVPGGFGVAKNLSTFAFDGAEFTIDETFASVMGDFRSANKPAAYMCIAPVLLPKVYDGVRCTIGNDVETVKVIEQLGGYHVECKVDDVVVDESYKVVTTPAYMLANNILEASHGIRKLIAELCRL